MLTISKSLIVGITAHLEAAYPEEGAGFLLGVDGEVREILALPNAREDEARHNRYLITPEDYLKAELQAAELAWI
jgi:proteasome lid subunit RPN8/RPN11